MTHPSESLNALRPMMHWRISKFYIRMYKKVFVLVVWLAGLHSALIFLLSPAVPYSNRVTVYGNNLRFDKVTRKDNGVYRCEVSGKNMFGQVGVKLTVLGENSLKSFCTKPHFPLYFITMIRLILPYKSHIETCWYLHVVSTVPPSPPMCKIPSSVRTGTNAKLTCEDGDGSPPPTYRWYRNDILLPENPSTVSGFQNFTYKLNPTSGILVSD